jgi:hypothetical protein
MQQLSNQELNDLLNADEAVKNFLYESNSEGNDYQELEKFVSDMDDLHITIT